MTRRIALALAAAAVAVACGSSSDEKTQADPLTCANYCSTVATNCAAQAPFDGFDCATYCGQVSWTPGTEGATSGNTLACRLQHATLAATNAALHCPHAGPTGAAVCGSYCDTYCELALEACTGGNQVYPDLATCQTACAGLTDGGATAINATSGDTVQCRIWHLGQALSNPSVHCNHSRATSATCF
jgi:hypothetical protein